MSRKSRAYARGIRAMYKLLLIAAVVSVVVFAVLGTCKLLERPDYAPIEPGEEIRVQGMLDHAEKMHYHAGRGRVRPCGYRLFFTDIAPVEVRYGWYEAGDLTALEEGTRCTILVSPNSPERALYLAIGEDEDVRVPLATGLEGMARAYQGSLNAAIALYALGAVLAIGLTVLYAVKMRNAPPIK